MGTRRLTNYEPMWQDDFMSWRIWLAYALYKPVSSSPSKLIGWLYDSCDRNHIRDGPIYLIEASKSNVVRHALVPKVEGT